MATLSHPNYIFAQSAGFHVLWDFFKEVDYPWSEIATTRTQIKQDRDLVMRYMRAHIEGIARFKQEPELGKRVIKKMLRLNDDAMAQESWELFAKHRFAAPYPNLKGMKTSYRVRRRDATGGLQIQTGRFCRPELRRRARQERLH